MQIQQIRNATMRINYSNKLLITDPYLSEKHELLLYAGKSYNPMVDLPLSVPALKVSGFDLYLKRNFIQ